MTSIFWSRTRRRAWLGALAPALLAGTLATGCGGASGASTPTPAASRPAFGAAGVNSAFAQCLRKHGVTLPAGRPGGFPTARPAAFPTSRPGPGAGPPGGGFPGGFSGSFRKAFQACRGSLPNGFPG